MHAPSQAGSENSAIHSVHNLEKLWISYASFPEKVFGLSILQEQALRERGVDVNSGTSFFRFMSSTSRALMHYLFIAIHCRSL